MRREDLLDFGQAIAEDVRQPSGEALVQRGPLGDRQGGVRRVADQDVPEENASPAQGADRIGPDELLADEGQDDRASRRAEVLVGELAHRALLEHAADDDAPLGDALLGGPAARGGRQGAR